MDFSILCSILSTRLNLNLFKSPRSPANGFKSKMLGMEDFHKIFSFETIKPLNSRSRSEMKYGLQKIYRHHEKIFLLLYLKHDGYKNSGSFPSWCDLWLLLWCFGVKWPGGPEISHHFWSDWWRRLRHFWDGRRKCQAKTFLYLSKMKNVSRDEHFLQKIKFYCVPYN